MGSPILGKSATGARAVSVAGRTVPAGLGLAVAASVWLTGCAPAPAVGPQPSPSAPFSAGPSSPAPTPSASGSDSRGDIYKLNVIISERTVSPLRRLVRLERGRTVVVVFRSDHDVTVTIKGPAIDKKIFVDKFGKVPASFVATHPGTIMVSSTAPRATVARIVVS